MAPEVPEIRPKLMTPYYPSEDSEGIPYTINTIEEKIVAEYAGVSIPDTEEFDVFTFWGLLRDAIIFNRSQTKEGRKWLKNAWRIRQTEPETEKLHRKIGGGGRMRHGSKNH